MGYLLGIGAVNVDLMGRSKEKIIMEDSNPGTIALSVGGVTHNICENAAKMGAEVKLISAVGKDFFGEMVRRHCTENGIDASLFYETGKAASSMYLSVHQPDGEMELALSDMRVLQQLPVAYLEHNREALLGASAIVMDCGLPPEVLYYVIGTYGQDIPVFIDPVSTTYARKLVGNMQGVHTVKPNLLEAQILADMEIHNAAQLEKAADVILGQGVRRLVVSMGRDGVFYADDSGARIHSATRPLEKVVNATGAGDAFMAGLIHSHLSGYTMEETLDFSMTAAILAISHEATINPEMSTPKVLAAIDEYRC